MGLGQKAENILYFYDKNMISSTDNHSCSGTFHNINRWRLNISILYPSTLLSFLTFMPVLLDPRIYLVEVFGVRQNYLLIVAAPRAKTDNAEEEPGLTSSHKFQVTMYDNEENL